MRPLLSPKPDSPESGESGLVLKDYLIPQALGERRERIGQIRRGGPQAGAESESSSTTGHLAGCSGCSHRSVLAGSGGSIGGLSRPDSPPGQI